MKDIEIIEAVRTNITKAGTLRALDRAIVGSNYRWLDRQTARLALDTTHWRGQAHGTSPVKKRAWEDILVRNSSHTITSARKRRMITEGLLTERCSICGCGPTWRGRSLTLILDHINGVRNDHRIENLRLVCPNCDSQLPTFCGRNNKKPPNVCKDCGHEIARTSTQCRSCAAKSQPTKIEWPPRESLLEMVQATSYVAVARCLGVSDVAVRKKLRSGRG